MSIRNVQETPCWQVATDLAEDLIPHFETEALATAHLTDWDLESDVGVQQAYSRPCVEIICDGCGLIFDAEEATHLDPADPLGWIDFADLNWSERDGKHYCEEHLPADSEPHLHRPSIASLPVGSPQLDIPVCAGQLGFADVRTLWDASASSPATPPSKGVTS